MKTGPHHSFGLASFCVATLLQMSCGGQAPAPSAPSEPIPAPAPLASAPAAPPASAEPAPYATPAPAAPTPAPASEPTSGGPSRTQKPIDILTAADVAFLIDYANSGARTKAQEKCDKEAKGDASALGQCLTKAREDFQPDVLRFRKDGEKSWSLLIYKRHGSSLRELSAGNITFGPETAEGVSIKFSGRQKGLRILWRGANEAMVRVPNDYSIEITDPELGDLRYDAKIGIVSE